MALDRSESLFGADRWDLGDALVPPLRRGWWDANVPREVDAAPRPVDPGPQRIPAACALGVPNLDVALPRA